MKINKAREALIETIVKSLDEDVILWRQEWNTSFDNYNPATDTIYKGVNRVILAIERTKEKYEDSRWLTFNNIKKMKYHLKKGSKGVPIEYWYYYNKKTKQSLSIPEFNQLIKKNPDQASGFFLSEKTYYVFNGDCIEGLPKLKIKEKIAIEQQVKAINTLSKNMGVPIFHDDTQAYYSSIKDEVHLPNPQDFNSIYAYISVAIHELSHATGHSSRLNRKMHLHFGDENYAKEELIAEMSAIFTSSYFKNPTLKQLDNHKAYIQNWSAVIKKDPTIFFECIKQAEKASDYLINYSELKKDINHKIEKSDKSEIEIEKE